MTVILTNQIPNSLKDPEISRFFDLIKSNSYSQVCVLVQLNPELINSKNKGKMSPLMEASFKGTFNILAVSMI